VLGGLIEAFAFSSVDFVSQSIRLGGDVIGDIGALLSGQVDRAGGHFDDRLDLTSDGVSSNVASRRRSRSRGDNARNIFNRAVDGCVDVVENSVNTFIGTYDRYRRFDFGVGHTDAADGLIYDYDVLNAVAVITHIERLNVPDHVRSILAYEKRNKNRESVITAGQAHLQRLLATGGTQSESNEV